MNALFHFLCCHLIHYEHFPAYANDQDVSRPHGPDVAVRECERFSFSDGRLYIRGSVSDSIMPEDSAWKAESTLIGETNYIGFQLGKNWKPTMISKAEGMYFTDSDGKKYLDFSSQAVCANLGHNNQHVLEAMKKQAESLAYASAKFGTEARAELVKKLQDVLPSSLAKYHFGNSGSDANEAAVKMVRTYFKKEGRTKIISRYNSYHGWTAASASLTGNPRRFAVDAASQFPGVVHVPDPYCYRCPFGLSYPECGVACAEYVDYVIKNESNVAALILEPVEGIGGIIVPPKEYLPRIREITEENDVFLIADEVMSGWGRTGEWFGVDNWGVEPDILTTAKGITGAHFPLSLTATNKRISDFFNENFFPIAGTFSAHPLGIGAAVGAIEEYQNRDLIQKSKVLGSYLGKAMEELKEKHPSVGDVRGIGLFRGMELVKNRATKEPFNTAEEYLEGKTLMVNKIARKMMELGVYVYMGIHHINLTPPLIVSEEEIDKGTAALDEALKLADNEVK